MVPHHYWAVHDIQANDLGIPNPYQGYDNQTNCPICQQLLSMRGLRAHLGASHSLYFSKNVRIMKARRQTALEMYFPNLTEGDTDEIECPKCKKMIVASKFNRHHKRHTIDSKCLTCNIEFGTEYTKRTHMIEVHNYRKRQKRYSCYICGKNYTVPSEVSLHIKTAHEGRKDHLCQYCGKAFRRVHTLNKHRVKVHLGIKPFKCKICNKSFACSVSCRKHVKKKHGINIEGRLNNPCTGPNMPIEKIDCKELIPSEPDPEPLLIEEEIPVSEYQS